MCNNEFKFKCEKCNSNEYDYVILATPFDYICDGARNLSEARKTEIARAKDIATAELIAAAVSAKNSDQIITIKPEWELIEEQMI